MGIREGSTEEAAFAESLKPAVIWKEAEPGLQMKNSSLTGVYKVKE